MPRAGPYNALWETTYNNRRSTLLPLAFDVEWTRTDKLFANDFPPDAAANPQMFDGGGPDIAGATTMRFGAGSGGGPGGGGGGNYDAVAVLQALKNKGINPLACNGAAIPIPGGFAGQILYASSRRTFVLIQNNSSAVSPNTAPNLIVGLDGPVSTAFPALYLNLIPGQGILLDQAVVNNAIYVAFSGGSSPTVVGGVCWVGYKPT